MADYTLSAKITGDATGFSKAIKNANESLNTLTQRTKEVGERINELGQKLSLGGAAITAGITTPFIGAIKTTADFDSAMRKAGAIAGATASELEAMTQAALDLGASTSLSSSEVAIAMTDLASKGFDANQVIAAMPGVISAAEASGEDLALTANTVASALNGFQLEADQSGRVADILAMTANKTAAGIEDMSYAFKYAAAPAASLGISIEELSAVTGLMVNAGLDGSQAGTTLRMALIRLAKPTEESSQTMERLGFEVLDAQGNFKPLNEIIGDLSKSMEGLTEVQKLAYLSTIFGTEAATGMLILLNEGQEGLKGLTTELENSSGASALAAEQMKAGIGGALENLSGAIESATISVMSQLTPLITLIAQYITSLIEKFNGLDEGTKKIIALAVGFVAAAGPALTILGLMTMAIGSLTSTMGLLVGPIGLVAVAIAGLIATFILFQDEILAAWNNHIKPVFDLIVSTIIDALQPTFESGFIIITDIVKGAFDLIMQAWESVLQPALETVIKVVQKDLMPAFEKGFKVVSDVVKTAFETINKLWNSILHPVIKVIISVIKMTLLPAFKITFTAIGSVVSTAFNTIDKLWTGTLKPIFTGIIDFITGVFSGNWKKAWSGVVTTFSGIFKGVSTAVKAPLNGVISMINTVIGGLNSLSISIPSWVPGIGGKTWGIDIPKIPQLARGTEDWQGGFARINEGGRGELVYLPNGAQVIPHDVSMRYAREAAQVSNEMLSVNEREGKTREINQYITINSPEPTSPSENARRMKQAARQLAMEWG